MANMSQCRSPANETAYSLQSNGHVLKASGIESAETVAAMDYLHHVVDRRSYESLHYERRMLPYAVQREEDLLTRQEEKGVFLGGIHRATFAPLSAMPHVCRIAPIASPAMAAMMAAQPTPSKPR